MRRFFENKIAFAAVVMLFALAFGWNLSHGAAAPWPNPLLVDPSNGSGAWQQAIPVVPPGQVKTASGPTMPPPPWEEVRITA